MTWFDLLLAEVLILYILPCELISSWHLPAADIVYWSSLV